MTNLTIKELQDFNDTQREIIEQQQGDINGLRKDVEHWREAWRRSVEESTTLKAEIEQLRGLLREWRDRGKHQRFYTTDFEKRVREALDE